MRTRLTALALLSALAVGCGGGDDGPKTGVSAQTDVESVPDSRPPVSEWTPPASEDYPDGKRIAAQAAIEALTYARGDDASKAAARLGAADVGRERLAEVLEPAVDPAMRSAAKVEYVQLSGLTTTTLGAMVVVEQRLQNEVGGWRSVTRVLDVRLVRTDGPWTLEQIASVGGSEVARPDALSSEAEEVLDNPRIDLPDSARWDVYRGDVDPSLLATVAEAGKDHELAITVFGSGHPPNVWATDRESAHTQGLAVDIWAVDGVPVSAQREVGSPAYELASKFVADGAAQLGSPWVLGPGGSLSFTDAVHADHLHLQQSPLT
jgi:hypothetical protein